MTPSSKQSRIISPGREESSKSDSSEVFQIHTPSKSLSSIPKIHSLHGSQAVKVEAIRVVLSPKDKEFCLDKIETEDSTSSNDVSVDPLLEVDIISHEKESTLDERSIQRRKEYQWKNLYSNGIFHATRDRGFSESNLSVRLRPRSVTTWNNSQDSTDNSDVKDQSRIKTKFTSNLDGNLPGTIEDIGGIPQEKEGNPIQSKREKLQKGKWLSQSFRKLVSRKKKKNLYPF